MAYRAAKWEKEFLEHYGKHGHEPSAAKTVGIDPSTVRHRRRKYPEFAVRMAKAFDAGIAGEVAGQELRNIFAGNQRTLERWQNKAQKRSLEAVLQKQETAGAANAALAPPRSPADAGERWVHEWTHTPNHLDLVADQIKSTLYRPRRLVVTIPVRHGKTTLCSWATPLWFFARRPKGSILITAHGAEFAHTWGRKVRDTIEEFPEYGWKIKEGASKQNTWELESGGRLHTAGVGGSITGRGFDLIIVDDPIKSLEDAYSETYRQKAWDWFQGTLQSRLQPGGSIIVLMSRWHEDDLVGRIFDPDFETESYDEIHIPAYSDGEEEDALGRKEGEVLWPEGGQTKEHLERRRRAAGRVMWSANWQGLPTPLEGNLFRYENWLYMPSWMGLLMDIEEEEDVAEEYRPLWNRLQGVDVRGWDLASSEKGDYTVGALMRLTYEDQVVIVRDVARFRLTPGSRDKRIRWIAELDGSGVTHSFPNDPGAAGDAQVHYLKRDTLKGFRVHESPETGDKIVRAIPYATRQENGRAILVQAPWNKAYTKELATVAEDGKSGGRHDDQLDASSRGHVFLTSRLRGRIL